MAKLLPFLAFIVILSLVDCFSVSRTSWTTRARSATTAINSFPSDIFSSINLAAEVLTKSDDYVYGAVAAPSWALPLGAVVVIGTAAIPVLLRPGEKVSD